MNNTWKLFCRLFVFCTIGFTAIPASADVKGDINNDNKIDLVESIYALRVASQSTGAGFQPTDLDGRVFYEVIEDSMSNQICVIEQQYGPSSVTAREWWYINDDSWIAGCDENYVPNGEAVIRYEIKNGVVELAIDTASTWQIRLVEKFTDNYLTSNPDGTATWYFTKEKVNAMVDPKIKFTQDILSANYWYIVETTPGVPNYLDCKGKFDFDGNITLTVQRQDDSGPGVVNRVYAQHNGSLITHYDEKIETETIWTYSPDEISTIKTVLHADGDTVGTGIVKRWYRDSADAEASDCFPLSDGTVKSAGRIWMDRNLGATRVATSIDDSEAYGDLYQWGRETDGHEKSASTTTPILASSHNPEHSDFILGNHPTYDWIVQQDDNLWQEETGINNPCPDGFRLPTEAEFLQERDSWDSNNSSGAFNSPLKLVTGGYRWFLDGSLKSNDQVGHYWTSSIYLNNTPPWNYNESRAFILYSTGSTTASYNRANGMSVRCIMND